MCDFEGVGQSHAAGNSSHAAELVLGLVSCRLRPVGAVRHAAVTGVTVAHGYGAAVAVPGVTLQGFELWNTEDLKSFLTGAVLMSDTRGQHHTIIKEESQLWWNKQQKQTRLKVWTRNELVYRSVILTLELDTKNVHCAANGSCSVPIIVSYVFIVACILSVCLFYIHSAVYWILYL